MTLVELLEMALRAYNPLEPHLIEDYYDSETEEEPEDADAQGDTLALFIVRELQDTFDQDAGTGLQLMAASAAMLKATGELLAVSRDLSAAAEKFYAAEISRRLAEVTKKEEDADADIPSRLPDQP